ncbi:MAG: hypothetical protein WKG07_50285 [Hymenobacter sp.]
MVLDAQRRPTRRASHQGREDADGRNPENPARRRLVIVPFLDRTKLVDKAIGTVEHNLIEGGADCDFRAGAAARQLARRAGGGLGDSAGACSSPWA